MTDDKFEEGEGEFSYSKWRGFRVYWGWCFFLWFFIVPLIAPTDRPLAGAPSIPPHLIALQIVVGYGLPALIVCLDRWEQKRIHQK